jgi:hypothetical protein
MRVRVQFGVDPLGVPGLEEAVSEMVRVLAPGETLLIANLDVGQREVAHHQIEACVRELEGLSAAGAVVARRIAPPHGLLDQARRSIDADRGDSESAPECGRSAPRRSQHQAPRESRAPGFRPPWVDSSAPAEMRLFVAFAATGSYSRGIVDVPPPA